MRFVGANVKGTNVYLDAGRDLVVASRQNASDSSSFGFNFSVTFTPNPAGVFVPTSGSIGGSLGQANRLYTDTPTTIIADQTLDAYVGNTTFLLGAMLNSKAGKLKLDTGTFVFDHFNDRDFEMKIAAQLQINPTKPDASGSLYYKDKQGLTYATVGKGEIKVRNAAPGSTLIALNRDAANVQKVVKNEVIDIKIPTVNLVAVLKDIEDSANFLRALAADLPESVKSQGRQAEDLYVNAVLRGMSGETLRTYVASDAFQQQLQLRNVFDAMSNNKVDKEVAAFLLYMVMEGERVYFDNSAKQFKFHGDCQTASFDRPCDIDLASLAKRAKDDPAGFKQNVLNIIYNNIAAIGGATGLANVNYGLTKLGMVEDIISCAYAWSALTGDLAYLEQAIAVISLSEFGQSGHASVLLEYANLKHKQLVATGSPLAEDVLWKELYTGNAWRDLNEQNNSATGLAIGMGVAGLVEVGPLLVRAITSGAMSRGFWTLVNKFLADTSGSIPPEAKAEVLQALVSQGQLTSLTEAAFAAALKDGAWRIAGFDVFGSRGLVGSVYNVNVFLIEEAGGRSMYALVRALEQQAAMSGAKEISIAGLAVVNKGFFNAAVAQRFGYSFEQINADTIILERYCNRE